MWFHRWMVGCVLFLGLCRGTGECGAAEESLGARLQRFLRERAPELYARSLIDYGWVCTAPGTETGPLPAELPHNVVVLVHGLDEPGKLWMNLAPELTHCGYTACEFRYPNDQPVVSSAAFLLDSLTQLRERGVESIIVVAHSMGGLVVREALTNPDYTFSRYVSDGVFPAVDAFIMVGTPNQGSVLARLRWLAEWRDHWARLIRGKGHLLGPIADGCGEAGDDLIPGSPFLTALNARPLPEGPVITIIAGIASPFTEEDIRREMAIWREHCPENIKGNIEDCQKQLLALASGIGDGAVPAESTRLEGISDYVTVHATHLSMIRNVSRLSHRRPPAIPIILDRISRVWQVPVPSLIPAADARQPGQ